MTTPRSSDLAPQPVPRSQILRLALFVEGGLLAAACVLALVTGVRFWEGVEVGLRPFAVAAALTMPMLAGIGVTVYFPGRMFAQIRRDVDRILPLFRRCTVLDLLIVSALAGIGEEALFRGVLQPFLGGLVGQVPALVLVAMLFGAVHPVSFAYAVFAAGVGLYLGVIQLWFGNLFVPMAVHGLYDFAALVFMLRVYRHENATD